MRMKALSIVFIVWLACFGALVSAHEDNREQGGLAVNVAFDTTGNLWRIGVKDGVVAVDVSHDLAKTFSKHVVVNQPAQKGSVAKCFQPKIAIGPEGNIYAAWIEVSDGQSAGTVWFSRSVNGGQSFEVPVLVFEGNAVAEALNVAPNGKVTLVWQNVGTSKAIHYVVSANGGASFELAQKLVDGGSACGSILTTNKPDGTVTAMWQHQFDGVEYDFMLAEIPAVTNQSAAIKRATFGHGKTSACREGSAALAIGGVGQDWWGYHMAYFSDNLKKTGLYYSRMDGVAWASSPAKRIGNAQQQAGQPALLSLGDKVWLVWREQNGTNHQILGMFSDDGGKNWQDAKVLARTVGLGDQPQLITKDKQIYLVWSTQQEGFRLLALPM